MWLAYKLPRRLVLMCAVRVGAHATTGAWGHTIVPDLLFMDAIRRWGLQGSEADADARLTAMRAPIVVATSSEKSLHNELRRYLDGQRVTSRNIGDMRRALCMPWECSWNGWVRDETAARENRG